MLLLSTAASTLVAACCLAVARAQIQLDLSDHDSIRNAASQAASGMVSWYIGNETGQTPGTMVPPYYWWEAGAMFMSLIDYWATTGDAQYNDLVTQGMLWQAVGPGNGFMPQNQTLDLGNDDQAFWAFAALEAAELKFPNPPANQPQWLGMAQAVFNLQADRWDDTTCGGGLRWQVFTFNPGYNYKNTIANGCFFSIGARLHRYTGNGTYATWAEKTWDWLETIGFTANDTQDDSLHFYDGASTQVTPECSNFDKTEWSYNAGVVLHGAANMWNATKDPIWRTRVDSILAGIKTQFFNASTGVLFEVCEPSNQCNYDQRSFKAYITRWMAATTQLAPWTYDEVMPLLQTSAMAAARSCSGVAPQGMQLTGPVCGLRWFEPGWDGWAGPGESMAAMSVFQANLIERTPVAVTHNTGGISTGDPSAGGSGDIDPFTAQMLTITKADRAGAWILTALLSATVMGGGAWICI